MLKITAFEKSYGTRKILEIPSLHLPTHIYWVKGSNGAGKSTLLKSLAGLLSFKGEVILEERYNLRKKPNAYRKLISFSEAEPHYPPFLTGLDLIKLFAYTKGTSTDSATPYLTDLGMTDYLPEVISTYSSGMLKKLSIVLAFLGSPKMILQDEPMNTLDEASKHIIYQWIEEKYSKSQVTFLISSHQPLVFTNQPPPEILLVAQQTAQLVDYALH
ncbi:MAG: ATP-binding cassette domain-containing protein [Thermonemataceae bacterium]